MRIRGTSNSELERKAALGKGSAGRYRKGLRGENITATVVLRIAEALRVRFEWLTDGTGEMFVADDTPVTDPQPNRVPLYESPEFRSSPPEVQQWMRAQRLARDLSTPEWQVALTAANMLFPLGLLHSGARRGVSRKNGD